MPLNKAAEVQKLYNDSVEVIDANATTHRLRFKESGEETEVRFCNSCASPFSRCTESGMECAGCGQTQA